MTTLHSFGGSDGDAEYPVSLIQAADGNFYGVTAEGGHAGYGTAFRVTPAGAVTILHAFDVFGVDGGVPRHLIQAADGNFYGTTTYGGGGFSGGGTAFRMNRDGVVTVLHQFFYPEQLTGPMMQADDGYFYAAGTAGPFVDAILRMSPDGRVTRMCAQSGTGYPGAVSFGQTRDGALLGATFGYDSDYSIDTPGTLFRVSLATTCEVLHTFTDNEGLFATSLISGQDGRIYGTTYAEGALFSLTSTGAVAVLYTFAYPSNAPLIQARDGNFYGTTRHGGTYGRGTIFRITRTGVFAELYSFSGAFDGGFPQGGLVQAGNGVLYGTTYRNGAYDAGTIFQIAMEGKFTTLHSFGHLDGGHPVDALVEGTDGALYRIASTGGVFNYGTVYRVTRNGQLTVVYAFKPLSPDDWNPTPTSLIRGVDGNLTERLPARFSS